VERRSDPCDCRRLGHAYASAADRHGAGRAGRVARRRGGKNRRLQDVNDLLANSRRTQDPQTTAGKLSRAMNDEEKQLDRLLGKWSAGERADARQIERLTQRIQTAWDAKDSPDPQYDAPAETRLAGGAAWRTPALWFSLGVAATVLIAASLFPWSRVRDP